MRKKRGKYLFLNELSQYTYYVHNTHYPQGKIERRENIGGGGGQCNCIFEGIREERENMFIY